MQSQSQVIDPNARARIKLYGKTVKNIDIARELAKKMKGTTSQQPMTQTQAGGQLGIKSADTITKFARLAKHENFLGSAADIRKSKNLMSANDILTDKLAQHPLVRDWIDYMKVKKDGKPLANLRPHVTSLFNFCRTLKIDPQLLIIGSDAKDKRDNVEQYIKQYLELYLAGKAKVKYLKDPKDVDPNNTRLRVVMPLRNFMGFHGVNFPSRMGGIWSASVENQQGKYADVRITDEQYLECQQYLLKHYGIESEVLRAWCIGVEGIARQSALFDTPKKIEKMEQGEKTIYTHKVYESKQDTSFRKYYHTPICRRVIDARQKSDSNYMFDTRTKDAWTKITDILKEMYRKYNFDADGRAKPDDPETAYCIKRPTHTLRHYGAQRWLLLTDWNKDVVYPMGWLSSVELTKSYGEPPAHVRAALIWKSDIF